MKMKSFKEFSLNESLPPLDPNLGYYDMSKGNMTDIIKILDSNGIEYEYDYNKNFLTINKPNFHWEFSDFVLETILISGGQSLDFFDGYTKYKDNHTDCVVFRMDPIIDKTPKGAIN